MEPAYIHRPELHRITKQFEDQMLLSRVSELARRGHLLEAQALLCPNMRLPNSADGLDLLARIHVKQGLYDQARSRWMDAIKTGDRRVEFEECIHSLDSWLEHRKSMQILFGQLVLYSLAALLGVLLILKTLIL